jgi:hypothetical protein
MACRKTGSKKASSRALPASWSAMLAATALAGCASFTYVDRQHIRHVVGLVNMTMDDNAGRSSARMTSATTFGLALMADPADGRAFALGYNRTVFLSLDEDACVDLRAAGPCRERAVIGAKETGAIR